MRLDVAEPGAPCRSPRSSPHCEAGGVAAVSPNGVLGDPTGASAAEGARLLDELATALERAVAAWPA